MERYKLGLGLSLVLDAQRDDREQVKQLFRVISKQEGWPEEEVIHLLEREGSIFVGLFLDENGLDGDRRHVCIGGVQILPSWVRGIEPWPVESVCEKFGISLAIPNDVTTCEVSLIGVRQDFRRSTRTDQIDTLDVLRAIDLLIMGIYRAVVYPSGCSVWLYSLLDDEKMPAFRGYVKMHVQKLSKQKLHYWCGGEGRGCPDACNPVWVCVTSAEESVVNWAGFRQNFLRELQHLCST